MVTTTEEVGFLEDISNKYNNFKRDYASKEDLQMLKEYWKSDKDKTGPIMPAWKPKVFDKDSKLTDQQKKAIDEKRKQAYDRYIKSQKEFEENNKQSQQAKLGGAIGDFAVGLADATQEAAKWGAEGIVDAVGILMWLGEGGVDIITNAVEDGTGFDIGTNLGISDNAASDHLSNLSDWISNIDLIHSAADDTEFGNMIKRGGTSPMYFVGGVGSIVKGLKASKKVKMVAPIINWIKGWKVVGYLGKNPIYKTFSAPINWVKNIKNTLGKRKYIHFGKQITKNEQEIVKITQQIKKLEKTSKEIVKIMKLLKEGKQLTPKQLKALQDGGKIGKEIIKHKDKIKKLTDLNETILKSQLKIIEKSGHSIDDLIKTGDKVEDVAKGTKGVVKTGKEVAKTGDDVAKEVTKTGDDVTKEVVKQGDDVATGKHIDSLGNTVDDAGNILTPNAKNIATLRDKVTAYQKAKNLIKRNKLISTGVVGTGLIGTYTYNQGKNDDESTTTDPYVSPDGADTTDTTEAEVQKLANTLLADLMAKGGGSMSGKLARMHEPLTWRVLGYMVYFDRETGDLWSVKDGNVINLDTDYDTLADAEAAVSKVKEYELKFNK